MGAAATLFLSISVGEEQRPGSANASVAEVGAVIGTHLLTLIRWESGQLVPSGPEGADGTPSS
ncbi:hypothetical protein [Nocardioides sp. InS609-2]|uniref:hypothetical protein n=1 Tax=Nocardioides sp. InS609-2 TaxID=2760705 RepID=UPI0020BE5A54|nr:hypothetical protein [Nocardioides sp. InS609-2]